ncbi:uncharacterized protein [Drosophila takahashii]|uniref:uncharacterized protein n=1 Tax=Drosophila takahashii TaxID=29030 RepID=UPI003898D716
MFQTLVVFVVVTNIWATDYNLVIEDPYIYTPCKDGPPGSTFIHDVFNLDNMVFDLDEDGIHVSGNGTVKWDFPPTYRISSSFSVMKFNRGFWEPTIYNMLTADFCRVMFDEKQYYSKYWWKHVRNRKEIEEKCLKVKDVSETIFVVSLASL